MDKRVTTTLLHDIRRKKTNGYPTKDGYPVKLRVIFKREVRYYACNMDLSESEYNKAMFGNKPRPTEKDRRATLAEIEKKARKVIDDLDEFSFTLFEKKFLKNRLDIDSVNASFGDYTKSLRSDGRIGSAITYECAINSLSQFKQKITFPEVTSDFLNKYQKWMIDKGNSLTTVGIYLRSLRTIFNIAINEKTISRDNYPFGRRKYEVPKGHNIKKALAIGEISKIFRHKAKKGSAEEMARDYWVFMYLCNGMNVKDFSRLKYSNIDNDFLFYERAKTARTKGETESIKVSLVNEAKAVIKKWGNMKINKDTFVFPVLNDKTSPENERKLVQLLTALVNKYMKKISASLELGKHITTYTARHSFSTVLKRSGASTERISEALGHSNVSTTKSYLASFEDESIKEQAKALTDFASKRANPVKVTN